MYRPPDISKCLDPDVLAKFYNMFSTGLCENKETFFLGDVIADYLNRTKEKDVKIIIRDNGLEQIIDKATGVTKDTQAINIIATFISKMY